MFDPEKKAKEDGEKSRELIKKLNGGSESVEPESGANLDSGDAGARSSDAPEPAKGMASEPPADPSSVSPEPHSGTPEEDENSKSWKDKCMVERGRLQAERNRLNAKIKSLEEEKSFLFSQLQQLRAQTQEKPTEKAPEEGIKPEDFEDYGPEFAKLVRKLISMEAENTALREKLTTQVNTEIAPLKQNMHRISMERFKSELTARVPHFEEQDRDPEFIEWLQDSDPYDPGHRARVDVLTESIRAMDVTRTSQFFLDFARESGRFGSNGKKETPPKEPAKPQNVQPNATRATTPPSPKTPKVWTRGEIADFYSAVAKGAFKGSEAEILATKRDIAAASVEGRVR